ncbi:phage repressor protein [Pseudomonas syringae pv. tomato]|uniref:Helix-turn-helix transcriptional regulator n=2 Tax=Pseudomonas syringae group TaxID=136849 RepID=A0AAW4E6C0_PSESX|nr:MULTISPECIES: S24 family peptidase [Pseudomonas syringae group]AVI83631.1 phage repressor protein [Pseudomonas syringae pv. tomato]EEB60427.1 phage repressor [Pseudomonas syringae pv. tomato T1]KGK95356.1 repressor [Pseudomonas syringae pv. tomato]KUR44856.1 transcriptional repressor DicA [Pseudomonas syringae pv. tomato]KUR46298.1 transcriptional repressor DicA [Pseudomonas syringae pv. tomato]
MNTLGQHIRKLRKEKGLSQQALAHACGWESQSRIGNYEKGTRQPSLQDIRKISDTLGVSFVDLVAFTDDNAQPLVVKLKDSAPRLTGKAKEGRVPVVGTAQLGNEGYFDALDFPPGHGDGYLNIHSDDPDAYGLKVTGDSMLPRIKNGEFVLIEPNKSYVSGDEVMVRTAAGRTMIKEYIYLRDGMYRFDSVNAEHPPIHIAENEILEIHLVGGILKSSRFLHTATEI